MKKHLHYWLTFTLALTTSIVFGQITSYPFVEDYESPSVYQITTSCDLSVAGGTYAGWLQDPNDDGDWRADSAGTGSTGTGPGSGRITTGNGTGTDANPGTTSGTYIYTEGSFATTACANSNINLLSPYFDFTASGKYYQLKFNYHMLGTSMGSLHMDVRNGSTGTWTNSLWSQVGEKDSAWILDSLNLANFNTDSVQIRVRAVMGTNWSSDIAFDNFQIDTFSPSLADAILIETSIIDLEYPIMPLIQFDSLEFSAKVKNEGLDEITSTKVTITTSGYSSVIDMDTIAPFATDSGTTALKYGSSSAGLKTFAVNTTVNETESSYSNNTDTLSVQLTDTVMAREDISSTILGIGANGGTIEVGQRFEIFEQDTITSITFYSSAPTIGDSVRVHLRNFTTTPGTDISTSDAVIFATGQNWYTAMLQCHVPVTQGQYFASVEQLAPDNMSLGYSFDYFKENTSYFGNGTTWTALEDNNPTFPVSLMVRINFGNVDTYREVNVTSTRDTLCPGEFAYLSADAGNTFSWSPANAAFSPTSKNTLFDLTESTNIKVVADFGCGLTATDSVYVVVKEAPSGVVTPDTTICLGQSITLSAVGGTSYQWINGPANTDWTITPTATNLYNVLVDSTNGCSKSYNTTVTVNEGSIDVSNDTAACSGQMVSLTASGADTYQWTNGPASALYNYTVDQTGYAVVSGVNSLGCMATDSILVTAFISPTLTPLNDTGACFSKFITITAGASADSFLWSNGDFTQSTTIKVLSASTLSVLARNDNGCESYDTLEVARYLNPSGSIDKDTTICEASILKINAYGGDIYEWSNGEMTQEISVSPTSETKYNVTIRSTEGCEDFEEIIVMVDPLPVSAFSYKAFEDSVAFSNESSLATSYYWDFGDGQSSTDEDPYNIYKDSGDYTIVLTATNDCGDVDSSITINVKVPKEVNGVDRIKEWSDLVIYPNPTNGIVNYTFSNQLFGDVAVRLLDINGRELQASNQIKGTKDWNGSVDLTELAPGVYTLLLELNGSIVTSKIIKH
jgi:PKD repeat protein